MSRNTLFAALTIAAILASASARGFANDREHPREPTGQVNGKVRLTGKPPVLPDNPVYKHKGQCGFEIPDERLIVGGDGALANVLVHVADIPSGRPIETGKHVVLDNRRCIFVPHVLSVSRGQTLSIRNSDPFLHDAHAWLGARTLFNVGLPVGKTVNKVLDEPGLIQINCNVRHTWMRAYVFVAENPYHTVTGADGRFVIDGLPPGTYTLRFWHELLGSTDRRVSLPASGTATIDVDFQPVAAKPGADEGSRSPD